MNGIHDMGGMQGFGAIAPEKNEVSAVMADIAAAHSRRNSARLAAQRRDFPDRAVLGGIVYQYLDFRLIAPMAANMADGAAHHVIVGGRFMEQGEIGDTVGR